MTDISGFANGLSEIPESQFTDEGVLEFMRSHPVSLSTLQPYLFFSTSHYTRNLILQTPLFELIAICWESGQKSRIHNHKNQRCWMAVAFGKVQVQNFRVIQRDVDTGFCELAPTNRYVISSENPVEVEPEQPIHLVVNPPSFSSRAVTLHVYSRPFDECEVYDLTTKTCETVKLSNTSELGVLTNHCAAERAILA